MSGAIEYGDSLRNALACQNCRRRKRKCDRQIPRCGLCVRRGLDCVMQVAKSADGQEGAVQSLEREISILEAQLSRLQTTVGESRPTPAALQPQIDPTLISTVASREQSLDTVDLDVLREVETVSLYSGELYCLQKMTRRALRLENCDPRGILNLTPKKSLLASSSRPLGFNELLDYDIVASYANKYFSYIHPTFPIISEDIVRSTLKKITIGSQSDLEDRIISYLVISIGAILPLESSAAFDTCNSADYFLRALEILYGYDESVTTAQIILLLTIYSLLDPSTGSSWHLIDLAMQVCIVMGYHQLQSEIGITTEADEIGVKLFQVTYILDFSISSALGLPMGIQNRDISFGWDAHIIQPSAISTSGSENEELSLVGIFSWTYELCSNPRNKAADYLSYYNEHILRSRVGSEGMTPYLTRMLELQLAAQSLKRSCEIDSTLEAQSKLIQDHLAPFKSSINTWLALPWITGYSIFQLVLLHILFSDGLSQKRRVSQVSQSLSLAEMVLSVISTKFPGLHPHSILLSKVLMQITSSDTYSEQNIDFLEGSDLYEFCRNALKCVDIGISH